mmetsp:Transcript_16881/g.43335  ORF Transcript_16881/g.43335 Transcript_16881/m.43335 type:complete len:200 (+) Transcript_16881:32-631(+)
MPHGDRSGEWMDAGPRLSSFVGLQGRTSVTRVGRAVHGVSSGQTGSRRGSACALAWARRPPQEGAGNICRTPKGCERARPRWEVLVGGRTPRLLGMPCNCDATATATAPRTALALQSKPRARGAWPARRHVRASRALVIMACVWFNMLCLWACDRIDRGRSTRVSSVRCSRHRNLGTYAYRAVGGCDPGEDATCSLFCP